MQRLCAARARAYLSESTGPSGRVHRRARQVQAEVRVELDRADCNDGTADERDPAVEMPNPNPEIPVGYDPVYSAARVRKPQQAAVDLYPPSQPAGAVLYDHGDWHPGCRRASVSSVCPHHAAGEGGEHHDYQCGAQPAMQECRAGVVNAAHWTLFSSPEMYPHSLPYSLPFSTTITHSKQDI